MPLKTEYSITKKMTLKVYALTLCLAQ